MNIIKRFTRFMKKFRIAIVLSLSAVFFGFMVTGLTNLAKIENPWVYIVIGFVGLVIMSWIGAGPLAMKKR